MIAPVQVAQAPAVPAGWTPANQLTCSAVGPIDRAATTFDLDLTGRKTPNAVIAGGDGPFGRVSSISVAATPAGEPARLIAIATGAAQYRLALTPAAGDGARVRMFALAEGVPGDLVMQGFCSARAGKRLSPGKLAALPAADTPAPASAWTVQAMTQRLPDRSCTLVGEDGRTRVLSYAVTGAAGNELTIAYRSDTADLLGTGSAAATGAQFFLVAPDRRMVSVTVTLDGVEPPVYVHTAFERSGTWIDITRDRRIVAAGACGAALPMLVGPPIGAVAS